MTSNNNPPSRLWSRRRMLQATPLAFLGGCAALEQSPTLNRIFDWFAGLNDRVGSLFFSSRRLMREFPPEAITATFKNNRHGDTPALNPATWAMLVGRLVLDGNSMSIQPGTSINLEAIKRLPKVTQITELRCVEGWSAVAKWGGVRFSAFLKDFDHRPEERFIYFYSADRYFDVLDMDTLHHPQTLLVYEMNDQPLPLDHGGPVRLIAPTKIGYKNVKWITRLAFTTTNVGGFWDHQGYPWYYGL